MVAVGTIFNVFSNDAVLAEKRKDHLPEDEMLLIVMLLNEFTFTIAISFSNADP